MKIYLATQIIINDHQDTSLTKMGGHKRLLPYYYLLKISEDEFVNYIKTGIKLTTKKGEQQWQERK